MLPRVVKALLLLSLFATLPVAAAPLSVLQDMGGEFHDLGEYTGKGKWLVVMIWASDCQVCNNEAHQYQAFHTAHQAKDAQILGISIDGWSGREAAAGFIKRHQLSFPNLIGSDETVEALFTRLTGASFQGTPTFLFFDPQGQLQAQQAGAVPTAMIEDFMAKENQARQSQGKAKGG